MINEVLTTVTVNIIGNVLRYQLPTKVLRMYIIISPLNPHCYSVQWLTYTENFREYLACYTIMNYLIHAHSIYVLCCCLLLWIILLSSSCNVTKVDKILILSIATSNIQFIRTKLCYFHSFYIDQYMYLSYL